MSESSMAPTERRLTVLYASETGTAEQVAERIGRIARRRHIDTHIYSMGDYEKVRTFLTRRR